MIEAPKPLSRFHLPQYKPKRLPPRKPVTIAAGLLCDEGLVLCSDTQESIPGYVKTDTQKMRAMSVHHLNLVVTGAGDSDLIEMTFDEIGNRLTTEQPSALWPIEKLIRQALGEIFKKCIGPYSVFLEGDGDRPHIPVMGSFGFPQGGGIRREIAGSGGIGLPTLKEGV